MKRIFEGYCPYCNSRVLGEDDWEEGMICIEGWCSNCNIYLLEDEVNWKQVGWKKITHVDK